MNDRFTAYRRVRTDKDLKTTTNTIGEQFTLAVGGQIAVPDDRSTLQE